MTGGSVSTLHLITTALTWASVFALCLAVIVAAAQRQHRE